MNGTETHVVTMSFDHMDYRAVLYAQALVPYCLFSFKTLIRYSTRDHQQAKLLAVYAATDTTHLVKILRQINEPWFLVVSESSIEEHLCNNAETL